MDRYIALEYLQRKGCTEQELAQFFALTQPQFELWFETCFKHYPDRD